MRDVQLDGGETDGRLKMEYTTLGNTGLRVSVAGLGCGGFSQLGLAQGKSEADAIAIIRQAHRSRGQSVRYRRGLRHRGGARQGDQIGAARGCRDLHKGAVQLQQPPFDAGGDRRQPRQVATAARYRLHRRLPAARRPAERLRPRAQRFGAGAACEKRRKANSAISALPRPRRTIPSTRCCTGRRRTGFGRWSCSGFT